VEKLHYGPEQKIILGASKELRLRNANAFDGYKLTKFDGFW